MCTKITFTKTSINVVDNKQSIITSANTSRDEVRDERLVCFVERRENNEELEHEYTVWRVEQGNINHLSIAEKDHSNSGTDTGAPSASNCTAVNSNNYNFPQMSRGNSQYLPWSDYVEVLRVLCEKKLPRHQIPHQFVQVMAMPLTKTGKIDRRRLTAEWEKDGLTGWNAEAGLMGVFVGEDVVGRGFGSSSNAEKDDFTGKMTLFSPPEEVISEEELIMGELITSAAIIKQKPNMNFSPTELKLIGLWAELLHIKQEQIKPNSHFWEL